MTVIQHGYRSDGQRELSRPCLSGGNMDHSSAGIFTSAEPITRFAWVLSRAEMGPDQAFDRDLGNSPYGAIMPTKGALIPEWLLLVPRERCSAVSKLPIAQREELLQLAELSEEVVRNAAGQGAVVFEHGAGDWKSAHGCGVDQAHLHVAGLGEEFLSFVLERSDEVEWTAVSRTSAWSRAQHMFDYLLMGAGQTFWLAETKVPISQFFRRHAAAYLKKAGEWDYKAFPQRANGLKTADIFAQAFA